MIRRARIAALYRAQCPMVSHPTQWLTRWASPCRQTLAGYRHQNAPGEGEMG